MIGDEELIRQLRAADPVTTTALAPDAAERAALVEEILAMPIDVVPPWTSGSSMAGRKRPLRYVWFGAAAAAVAVVSIVAVSRDRANDSPAVQSSTPASDVGVSPPAMGSCVELYDLQTLRRREYAFDGTVTSIEGDRVTFSVNEWYSQGAEATITLTGNGMASGAITSAGDGALLLGERYLVAGDGGFVWSCGFTQPYDALVADQWRTTLSS